MYKIKFLDGTVKEFETLIRANLYGADLREANLEEADLRRADLKGADLRRADLKGANLYGADLRGADLEGADLYGANLKGADLEGADLYGAYLKGANLKGADLYGADLKGADIIDTGIIRFQFNRHEAYYFEGNLQIGCHYHSLEYWKAHFRKIGFDNDYTETEIEVYGMIINKFLK